MLKKINLKQYKNIAFLFFSFILAGFYIWTRLYKIDSSLLFFNDIGRDFLVLFNWFATGKPPLLGPQTSALPYNQTAIYFYLLAPLYLLTGQSFFASVYTVVVFYLGSFIWGIKKLWQSKDLFPTLLIASFLLIIHPQQIIQNRFVWNPSFITPLILIAWFAWWQLKTSWSKKTLIVFTLSSSLAVSLNYSAAPVFLAFMILTLFYLKKRYQFMKVFLFSGLSLAFWNLPTIFFELRHNFLLTNLLIYGEKLPQNANGVIQKLSDLTNAIFVDMSDTGKLVLLFSLLFGFVWSLAKLKKSQKDPLLAILKLLFLSLIITLVIPISIQNHYIFGFLSLLCLFIAFLGRKVVWLPVLIMSFFWIKPILTASYFQPAYRSVLSSDQCAKKICGLVKEPTFVSVQSDLHPYHNGMEWKYLLLRNGCLIKELDAQIDQAEQMVVIVDNSDYQHNQTAYNELTQFGQSLEIRRISCQEKLEAVLLRRH